MASPVFSRSAAQAAAISKNSSTGSLSSGTDWIGGIAPGSFDTASWDNNVGGANSAVLGAAVAWQGIAITNPGGTAVIANDASTLTLGSGGINMGGASSDFTISSNLTLAGVGQTWNVATGRTLTLNTGAFNRATGGALNIQGSGTIAASMSNLANTIGIIGDWATIGSGTLTHFVALSNGTLGAYNSAAQDGTWGASMASATTNFDVLNASTTTFGGSTRTAYTVRFLGASDVLTLGNNNSGAQLITNALVNAGSGTLTLTTTGLPAAGLAAGQNKEILIDAASGQIISTARIHDSSAGSSAIITTGASTITFNASNDFSGGTYVDGGTLNLAFGGSTGTVRGTLNINPGAQVNLTATDALGFSSGFSVTQVNVLGGTLNNAVAGNNSYQASWTLTGGTMSSSGGGAFNIRSSVGSITTNAAPTSSAITGPITLRDGGAGQIQINVADGAAATDLLISGVIAQSGDGSNGFNKLGAGNLVLTAANTFQGPTTVTAGTLQLGDGTTGHDGTLADASAVTITGGATLTYNRFGSVTSGYAISGGGAVIMSGTGTQTLTGASSYTGPTNIVGGALVLGGSGAINSTSAVSVTGSGARFVLNSSVALSQPVILTSSGAMDGSGSSTGQVTVSSGTIANGSGTSNQLTLGSLSISGTSTASLNIQGGGANTTAGIVVSNQLASPGTGLGSITLNVTAPANSLNPTVYDLIKYGSLSGLATDYKLGTVVGLTGREAGTVINDTTNGAIALNVTGLSGTNTWTGASNGNWITGTSGNWNFSGGGAGVHDYFDGDTVIFDNSATGTTTISISTTNVSPASMTFNNTSKNYVINGPFSITGAGSLAVSGTGAVTINNSNSYTGPTTISGGSLNLNGSLSGTAISNGATFNEGATGSIVGAASVTNAAGTTTLAGSNTYAGATSVTGGTLNVSGSVGTSTITVTAGTLGVTGSINPGSVAGLGQITVGSGTNSNGVMTIGSGIVNATRASAPSIVMGTTNTNAAGDLRMTGGVLNSTSEMWLGTADGQYGAFTLSGGTANIGSWLALSRGGGTGVLNVSGGTLNVTGNNLTIATVPVDTTTVHGLANFTGGTTNITNAIFVGEQNQGVMNVSGTANVTAAGGTGVELAVSGASGGVLNLLGGTLTTTRIMQGAGTGTGANNSSGIPGTAVNFNGGTLKAGTSTGTFLTGLTSAYVYSGGGTINNGGFNVTIGQALLDPSANGQGISSSGINITSSSGFIDTPIVEITGGGGSGATAVASVNSSGTLTAITITNPGFGYNSAPTFTLAGGGNGSAYTIDSSGIGFVSNSGGGVNFTGAGVTTLTANSTYTGPTAISGGNVILSGSAQLSGTSSISVGSGKLVQLSSNKVNAPITVNSGGALDGTTSVGAATINTGGTIANGNGTTGTLTLDSLTLASSTTMNLNIAGGANVSSIALSTGPFTVPGSGTVTVNITPTASLIRGSAYDLVGFTSSSGSSAVFALGAGFSARDLGASTFGLSGGYLVFNYNGDTPVWTGANGGTWTTITSGNNTGPNNWALLGATTPTNFWADDNVIFRDRYNLAGVISSPTTTNVVVTGTVAPTLALFNNSALNYTLTGTGAITSGALTKTGTGTLVMGISSSYTGTTSVNGGTFKLDYTAANAPANNMISASSPLALGGGNLNVNAKASGSTSQGFAGATVNNGGSSIVAAGDATANPLIVNLGAITRNNGGALTLTLPTGTQSASNGVVTSTGNTNSILGPWAFVNNGGTAANNTTAGYTYATVTSTGNIVAYTGATASGFNWASGNNNTFNYDVNSGTNVIGVSRVANTIRYTGPAVTQTYGNGGVITVTANGLLNAGSGTLTLSNGSSTGQLGIGTNNGNDLVVNAASAPIVVNFPVVETTAGSSLTTLGTGTNAVILAGTSSYTGPTTVAGGVLNIAGAGAINTTSGIKVNGTTAKLLQTSSVPGTPTVNLTLGTIDGTGTLGAVTVANSSGNVLTNGAGGTGTLTLGALTFNGAATVNANVAAGSVPIAVSGTLTTTPSSGQVVINPIGTLSAGTIDLITDSGFSGSISDFTLGTVTGISSRNTVALVLDGSNIALNVGSGGAIAWNGGTDGAWVTAATGDNTAPNRWNLLPSATATNFWVADTVQFNDTNALGGSVGTTTININAANVSPTSATFGNSTLTYTLASSGGFGITGSAALSMTGTGTLIVTNSNTYTGATTIGSGATLRLGDGTTGHDGSIASTSGVNNSGQLIFNRFGAVTSSYPITGSGSVTMTGTGTQTLAGSSSYTGGTTVTGGVLATSADNNLGASSSGVTLNGGTWQATAAITNTHAFTFGASGGTINVNAGGSQLYFHTANTLLGSGTLTLTGPGTLISPQGNLRIDQTNSFNGPVVLTQGGIFEYGVLGAVDGAATFTISNQGELAEQNAVSIPNAVTVSGGTNSVISFENGNTGDYTGSITLNANAIIGLRDWYNNATVRSGIIDGVITGTGGITVNSGTGSGGSLTLSAANTYTGGTTISASKVLATNNTALGSGSVNISGAAAQLELGGGVTLSNPLIINGGAGATSQGVVYVPTASAQATYAGPITINSVQAAGGHFAANGGTLVLTGPITSSVPVAMRTGTMVLSNTSSSYSGMLIQAATVQLGANNAIPSTASIIFGQSGNATLDLASFNQTLSGVTLAASGAVITNSASSTLSTLTTTGTSTFAGNINDGAGTVALSVNGGQLALTSANTYSGPTAISGGTLTVSGSLTSSNVSINSAGAMVINAPNSVPASTAVSGSDAASSLIVNQSQTIGSMGFAGSTTVASGATLTVNPVGPSTAGPIGGAGTLAVTGASSLTAQSIRTGALTVAPGSTAAIAYDAQAHTHGTPIGTSVVTTLSVDSSGTLDLTNNGIVILDTTSLGAVKSLITQAADVSAGVPHWDMPGITSSTAAADHSHAIGYALASTLPGGGSTSFNGVTFSDAVIARYTLVGDTGLKGTVDLSDYTKVVLNLGKSNAGWSDGNFDYSGNVNLGDYTAVIRNLGRSDGQSTVFNATGPSAAQVKASALTLHSAPAVTQASTATDVTLLVNPTNGRVTLVNALQTGQAVITAYTINSPSQSLLPFSADGGGKYLANALENNPSVFYKASNGLTYNLWTGIKNVSTFIGEGFSNHYNANVDSTWTNYTLATSGYALGTLFKRLSSGGTKDLVFQWEDANLNTYTSVVTYVGAVPEPGSVSLVAVGAMAMLGRRRRRSVK